MGIYTGSTLHEVAHVVGAGNAMGEEVSNVAIIVKMIRVMLLVPVLLVLGWWVARRAARSAEGGAAKGKVAIPWFAVGFLAVIGFNSFDLLPMPVVDAINYIDTFQAVHSRILALPLAYRRRLSSRQVSRSALAVSNPLKHASSPLSHAIDSHSHRHGCGNHSV